MSDTINNPNQAQSILMSQFTECDPRVRFKEQKTEGNNGSSLKRNEQIDLRVLSQHSRLPLGREALKVWSFSKQT